MRIKKFIMVGIACSVLITFKAYATKVNYVIEVKPDTSTALYRDGHVWNPKMGKC